MRVERLLEQRYVLLMKRIGKTTYRELLNVALKINKILVKPMENTNLKCSFTLEDKLCEVTHRIGTQCCLDWVDEQFRET